MSSPLRPSLAKIIDRITNDAKSRYNKEFLRRSDVNVAIRVIAGASHEIYSAIEYGRKQLFTETAETSYLERRGRLFDIYRKPATYATGTVQFNWENPVVLDTGTLLQDTEGHQFETTSAVTSSGAASIRATVSGTEGNIESGVELTLVSAISGVSGAVTTSEITGGTNAETDDSLRERILNRTQKPPRTGTAEDYIAWCLEVSGVTRAWCYPREMGTGTVTVRIMSDNLTQDGFPTDELLSQVQTYLASKADVLATIYVEKPVAQPVDIRLSVLPDNTSMRQHVEERIKELFTDEAIPGGTIYLSHLNAAISEVVGEEDHIIVSPAEDMVAQSSSHMLTVGAVTWQGN